MMCPGKVPSTKTITAILKGTVGCSSDRAFFGSSLKKYLP